MISLYGLPNASMREFRFSFHAQVKKRNIGRIKIYHNEQNKYKIDQIKVYHKFIIEICFI